MDENLNQFLDINLINKALKAGNTGLWKIDINTVTSEHLMYADDTMLDLLGLKNSLSPEACFKWWFDRISTIDEKNYINKTVEYAFANNKMIEVDYYWDHPLLGCVYVRCGGTPIEPNGDWISLMGYHQNINDLHDTKKNLQKYRVNLKMACQLGNMSVFELSMPYKHYMDDVSCNELCTLIVDDLFANMFNVDTSTSTEIIWSEIAQNMLPEMQTIWNELLIWKNWKEDFFINTAFLYTHPQKEVYWLSLNCKCFVEADDYRIVGYITDITEKKERELSFKKAKESAESANLSKSLFLTNMSHEIRTPMHAVINLTRLLMDTNLDEMQKNYVSKIVSSGKRMMNIMNDILDFSVIDSHKMEILPTLFCVQSEINNICELATQWVEEKKLLFVAKRDGNIPPYLIGDALRIRQILINLFSNAYKFTPSGSIHFTISLVSQVDDCVRIRFSVKDSGIGMTKEEQETIFTAFNQADLSSTRQFGGIGLGLAISSRLVKLMNGTITVESNIGTDKGSTVSFELPLKIATEPNIIADFDDSVLLAQSFHGLRCMIVEDNLINQEILFALLKSLGIESLIVNNGQEALSSFYKDQSFDCIFMDIQMPVMDGYTATSMIRQSPYRKGSTIPIIAITANTVRGDDVKSISAGMNIHLTKPIELKTIIKVLNDLVLGKNSNSNYLV